MKMKKHILLGLVGIAGSLASAIAAMLSYEDKVTEMNRQVNAAVDKRFMQLVDNKNTNEGSNQ